MGDWSFVHNRCVLFLPPFYHTKWIRFKYRFSSAEPALVFALKLRKNPLQKTTNKHVNCGPKNYNRLKWRNSSGKFDNLICCDRNL